MTEQYREYVISVVYLLLKRTETVVHFDYPRMSLLEVRVHCKTLHFGQYLLHGECPYQLFLQHRLYVLDVPYSVDNEVISGFLRYGTKKEFQLRTGLREYTLFPKLCVP